MDLDNRQIVYIHGLYSSKNSKKFRVITKNFPTAICVEWKVEDNIFEIIQNSYNLLKGEIKDLVLIGSSTGGNFAWQLQKKLLENGKSSQLILLNPLIDITFKFLDDFPSQLSSYLVPMNIFVNTKVFLGMKDEVLDAYKSKKFFEIQQKSFINQIDIIEVEDGHRLDNFSSLLLLI